MKTRVFLDEWGQCELMKTVELADIPDEGDPIRVALPKFDVPINCRVIARRYLDDVCELYVTEVFRSAIK